MAKELPYYKHEPSEWLEGEIQVCSDAAIVCFTNLRDGYWLKLGCMSYAFALQKYCRRDASILDELINNGIVDLEDGEISIKFLDNQLNEFQDTSEKRRVAANKRWKNAKAMQVHSKSNAIREDKIREDKIVISRFDEFWDIYDKKVGDKDKIKAKFDKLPNKDIEAIFQYIPKYIKSQPDKQFRKNPSTFLNQKGWLDEIIGEAPKKKSSIPFDMDSMGLM